MSQEKPPQENAAQDNVTQDSSTQENAPQGDAHSEKLQETEASSGSKNLPVADADVDIRNTDASNADNTNEQAAFAADPATVEPMKGVGFLGRHGTAPINTSEAPNEQQPSTGVMPEALPGTLSLSKSESGPTVAAETADLVKSAALANSAALAKSMAVPPLKPGIAENTFRLMSYAGLIFLLVLLVMQTAAGVYFPTVFLPSEAVLAEAYELTAQAGQWLAPPATAALPAALPGYFWFLAGVDMLPWLGDPFFLPVAATLAALVALLGTYALGLCTGLGNKISFAAGLMLLSALGFVPMTHWVGPDVLLAGILALSLGCLYRGWASERSFIWLPLGFMLASVGTLVGGLISLWIPLTASIFFIFWRGTLRRGHRLDAVLGFGLLLVCLAAWLGGVILLTGDSANALAPLFSQLMAPLLPPLWPPKDPWWHGLALLGVGLLPWIFIPLFVSWNKVAANAWPALKASRKENAGVAWLWICLACGLALLVVSSAKPWFMAVPLLPLATVLLAKALLRLSHTASRLFFLLLALLCLAAGTALSVAGIPVAMDALKPHLPICITDLATQSAGLPLLGGVLLLAALILVRFTNRAYPGGALAVFVLLVTMLVQPATLLTGPSHAGKLGVHLSKGMGVGVLPSNILPGVLPMPVTKPAAPEAVDTPPSAPKQEQTEATPAENAAPEATPAATADVPPQAAPAAPMANPEATPVTPEEKLVPQPALAAPPSPAKATETTETGTGEATSPPASVTPAQEPEKIPQSMPRPEGQPSE